MKGLIFDIKEFALNDGGGIRTTVFFKGCPLRCIWCHNPEGQSPEKELFLKRKGCLSCGLCCLPCEHPECREVGRCLHICPKNLVGVAGKEWDAQTLSEHLLKRSDVYRATGGGVTLSGGEPLMQADFACELFDRLSSVHRALETCGYAPETEFRRVIERCDFVYMDLKLSDDAEHRTYTGVSNEQILANAEYLKRSGREYRFRIPLIPGITDTEENLRGLSNIVGDSPVELLGYNRLAPAKYASVGRKYTDEIDGTRSVHGDTSLFSNAILRN